ncbi:MAG TPA: hypothetical protein VF433_11485, partial [Cellvibrio sp.]
KKLFYLSLIVFVANGCSDFRGIDSSITHRESGLFEVYTTSTKTDSEAHLREAMYVRASKNCEPLKAFEVGQKQEGIVVLIIEGVSLPNERYIMEGLFECK